MIRTLGVITLGSSSQPLFGDTLTAAFSNASSGSGVYKATVANSAIYKVGDRWVFGVGSGNPTDILMVTKIVDGTHVQFMSEGGKVPSNWASGTILMLSIPCAQIIAQAVTGNTALAWLGSDLTVTNVGGGTAFGYILQGGQYNFGQAQWNCIMTSDIYIAGTSGDKFAIAAIII